MTIVKRDLSPQPSFMTAHEAWMQVPGWPQEASQREHAAGQTQSSKRAGTTGLHGPMSSPG